MIIHFMQDEKFIDSFIDQYLATHPNSETKFYIYLSKTIKSLKHVKNKEIIAINLTVRTLSEILRKHESVSHVYFHNFPKNMLSICQHIPMR